MWMLHGVDSIRGDVVLHLARSTATAVLALTGINLTFTQL
jgi:hypothetical protein